QRVADQVTARHGALAFDVRGAGFETNDVILLQLKFRRVFDRDDTFVGRNEAGERVEQRGFTATGAAGDEAIEPSLDTGFRPHRHFGCEGLEVEQVFEFERVRAESANGHRRAVEGERRDDGVDAAAVRQAGIDHGRCFIDAPADLRYDAVDD